jgi:hypothetical protein
MLATNLHKQQENEMNRTNLLVTSAVIAFVATTGASMAQQEHTQKQERSAPAEKVAPQNAPAVHNQAPNGRVGESQNRGHSETTGQAPREGQRGDNSEQERGKAQQPQRGEQNRTTGQAPREGRGERNSVQERGKAEQPQRNEQNRTTGQAPREDRLNGAPEQNRTTGQAPREDRTNQSSEQNTPEQGQQRPQENRATTGQGAAGTRANINLTPEKRTRIHEVIVQQRNAPRVSKPNFDVSVGARVPRTVRFAALPQTIVEIEPEWRGFEYFMIGDQIVIVDPKSMDIVAVFAA